MIPKKTGVPQNPGRYGFKLFYTHLNNSLDIGLNSFRGGSAGKRAQKKPRYVARLGPLIKLEYSWIINVSEDVLGYRYPLGW